MKTHLVFGILTLTLLAIIGGSRKQQAFSFERVVEMAQAMATGRYLSAVPVVPEELTKLTYDQFREIRWKDERTLWRKEGLPFQVRFFHPGYLFQRPVEIYDVEGGRVERLRYSPDFFDFGKNTFAQPLPQNLGYAGFRVYHPLHQSDKLDEFLVFLGASYFRAVGREMSWGASARGLAIDAAMEGIKEEFPAFTKFWMIRPDRFARQLTFFALLESRRVTGAYQFEAEPGPETRLRVKAVLFFRESVKGAGMAPLTSMYWFGENTSNTFGDFRPEVHDSDGLLMHRSSGEWVWHPLSWSPAAQWNAFADTQPKGFGLMQRDRDFNHYQDLESLYHTRPGVWVELIKGFDTGEVRLAQLPARDEFMDNVVAYWTPAEPPPVRRPIELEYVIHWVGDHPGLPPIGRCLSTRVDYQDTPYFRHFFLEFGGGTLGNLKEGVVPEADVSSPTGAVISETKVEWNEFNRSWRVSFLASTNNKTKPVDLVCRLKKGGEVLSETWSYTWTR